MKLPRDIGGEDLATLLKGTKHNITIPKHTPLRVGTLSNILKDIASYLKIDKQRLIEELFRGR